MGLGNEGDGNITAERKVWHDQDECCGRWDRVKPFEPSLSEVNGAMGHSAMANHGNKYQPPRGSVASSTTSMT